MVTDNQTTSQSDATTAFLRAARSGNLEKVVEYLDTNLDINTANSNGLNALHLASKDGHVEIVTELLKRGAKVDAATKKGNTALHIASLAGQSEVVTILIQYGAAVNIQSQNGFTPLYMAAQENHDQAVKILLGNGANQSLATEDGFTPLAVAMQQGHDKVVSVLLENDSKGKVRLPALHIAAKKDDCKAADLLLQNDHKPDVTSKSGFTPLHIAAHYGNEDIARLLIKRGADVNYLAKHNISPLHVAAKWGKNNMVKILLEHGAVIDAKTRDGLTPLHCAARSGHEQCVTTLLESSAPISARSKNGLAPLHMASQGDHVDAVRVLLYHRAPVDEVTIDYLTSLHVAAHCGHVRVAKLLLDRKADPNARALNGFTPLHIACKKNHIKVVELLLKHGASIESTTESGLTPLHVASFMGCMNIVIYLLQHEASPDVPTVRGETPLHLAARANQTDIIRILLRNGAKVDARAREQQTPLHIASRLGNVDIVMLLLQHGAAVDTTTKDMYTALHIAAKEGQEEVAAILVDNNASVTATTKNGFTPLAVAAKYGNMNVAKILLQKEGKLDAQGKNNITPLLLACHYDHPNVAQLLLEKGASPHLASQNGQTPLHVAARKNQMDIAMTLIEHGAKADVESKAGFTPLHLSAQKGHYDMTNLLIEHGADPNHRAKNGLTALHLCAQEDFIRVASILVKNGADVESQTETGYRPIHVAAHFGNLSMVRFLLKHGAEIDVKTKQNYTPLHQAAQQGHAHIVSALVEGNASHRARTNDGLTALNVAQKLGYISVMEVLKGLSYDGVTPDNKNWEEKYKVIAPESLQETSLMSDSDDEGEDLLCSTGSDALMSEQPYRYLTADLMKNLRDDSLPIDVTRDDPIHRQVSKQEHKDFVQSSNYCSAENFDSSDYSKFLVSFLVDARGGTMKGCRHSGIRLIVPPRRATMPIRVTCRLVKPSKMTNPPPLMEGESLATRVIEMGPVGASFLGPVLIDIPHFASVAGKEREIIILRSENGETWKEHDNSTENDGNDSLLNTPYDAHMSTVHSGRITRIMTTEFPQYFAVVTRIKQEVHVIGSEGGILVSSVADEVQAVFPPGALTKKIKVGLQAHVIPAELTAKLLGNCVAVSPVITIEPRRRKFHKPISLTLPVPRAANKGMINHYGGETPTLRLLCSIAGGTSEAQWEDVTGSTPLNFTNDRVSFTTTVSARFWLMDCRNIQEVPKMATDLYRESLFVPFVTNFVIYSKRMEEVEAILRILCMTDSKEGIHTLEKQEEFSEIVKSRDVETLDGKDLYIEFTGNLVPVTKSGQQLKFTFRAFRQNRLSFQVKVKDPQLDPVARMMFMREPKVAKGEPAQQPLCVLNIVLPDVTFKDKNKAMEDAHILAEKLELLKSSYKLDYPDEKGDYPKRTSPGERKFITDTLQKEHPDAVGSLLAHKSTIPLESVDDSYSGQDLSPTTEKKTYSEKRRFWEDIARSKRESFQRSESEVSHTSQLTYHDSDSECLSEVRERSEDEAVDQEHLVDAGLSVDMSECTVAEKAHYFEEQIQKETSAARESLKSQSSQESARIAAARLSGISMSSEDDRSLEVFEETERILEEKARQEIEMRDKTGKVDVKEWDERKEEKKDCTTEKSEKQKSRGEIALFDNKVVVKEMKDDKKMGKGEVPKKGERKKSKDEKELFGKKDSAKEEKKDERIKSKDGKDVLGKRQDSEKEKTDQKNDKVEKELSVGKSDLKEFKSEQEKQDSEKKISVKGETTEMGKITSELASKETVSKIDKKVTSTKSDTSETKIKLDTKSKTVTKTDTDKESKAKATKMQENVSKQQKVVESKSSVVTAKSTKVKEETSPKSIPPRQKSREESFSKSPPKKDKSKDEPLSKSPPKKDKPKDDIKKSSPKLERPKEATSKMPSKADKGKEITTTKSKIEEKVKLVSPKSISPTKEISKQETSPKYPSKSEKSKVEMISPTKKEKMQVEISQLPILVKQKSKEELKKFSEKEAKLDETASSKEDSKISVLDTRDKIGDPVKHAAITPTTTIESLVKDSKKDTISTSPPHNLLIKESVTILPVSQVVEKQPESIAGALGSKNDNFQKKLDQTLKDSSQMIEVKTILDTPAALTKDIKQDKTIESKPETQLRQSSSIETYETVKTQSIFDDTSVYQIKNEKIAATMTQKDTFLEKSFAEKSLEEAKPAKLQTKTPEQEKSVVDVIDKIQKPTPSNRTKTVCYTLSSTDIKPTAIPLITSKQKVPEREKSKDEISKSATAKREKSKDEFHVTSPTTNKKPTEAESIALKKEKSKEEISSSVILQREKSNNEFSLKSPPADKKPSEISSIIPKREKSKDNIPKSMIPRREKSKEEFSIKSSPLVYKTQTELSSKDLKQEKSDDKVPKVEKLRDELPTSSLVDEKSVNLPSTAPKREKSKDEIPKSMIPRREKSKDEFSLKSPLLDKTTVDTQVMAPKREKSKDEIPKSMIPKREKSKDEFLVKSPSVDKKSQEILTTAPKRETSKDEIPKSMIPKREKSKDEFSSKSPPVDKKPSEIPSTVPKREKSKDEIPKSMIPRREKSREEFTLKSPPTDKKQTLSSSAGLSEVKSKDEIPKSMTAEMEKSKDAVSTTSPLLDKKPTDLLSTAPKREKSKDEIPKSMIPRREKSKDEFSLKSPPLDKKTVELPSKVLQHEESEDEIPKSMILKREQSKDEFLVKPTPADKNKSEVPSTAPKREKSTDEISKSIIPKRQKSTDEFSLKSPPLDKKPIDMQAIAPKREKSKDEIPKSMIPRREKSKDEFTVKSPPTDKKQTELSSTVLKREKSKDEIPKSMIPKREKSKDEFPSKSPLVDKKPSEIPSTAPKREKSKDEIPKSMIPRREKSKDEFFMKSPPADKKSSEISPTALKREKSKDEIPKSMIQQREKSKDKFTINSPLTDKTQIELPSKALEQEISEDKFTKVEKSKKNEFSTSSLVDKKPMDLPSTAPKREKSKDEIPKSMIPRRENSKEEFSVKSRPLEDKTKDLPSVISKRERSSSEIPKSMIPKREKSKDEFLIKSPPQDVKDKGFPFNTTKREKSIGEIPKSMIPRREKSKDEFLIKSPPQDVKDKGFPFNTTKREKSIGEIPKSMIPRREKSKDEFLIKSSPKDDKDTVLSSAALKREKSSGEFSKSMIPRREKSKDEFSITSPIGRRNSKELSSTSFKREKSSGELSTSMIPRREKSKEEFSLQSPPKKEKLKDEFASKALPKREKSKEEIHKAVPKREKSKDEILSKPIMRKEKSKEDVTPKVGVKRQDSKGEELTKTGVKKTESSGKISPKKDDVKDLPSKSGVKRRDSKEEQSKGSTKKSSEFTPKVTPKRESSREEILKTSLTRRRDSKELKDEIPKTPVARRRDSKEESPKSLTKRGIPLKDSDSKSSSKSSLPSPKSSEKSSKKESLSKKESETVTVTKTEKSKEITTQEHQEYTQKQSNTSQLVSGTFRSDPKDAFELLENTSALKNSDLIASTSVTTSKVDHKATSLSEKKEVKSSEIDTGKEKIIALEEKEDFQKKETSISMLQKDCFDDKVKEKKSKGKETSESVTQKTLVNLTDDFERVQASALQKGQDRKYSVESRSVENNEKIVTTTETSNLLKESTAGTHFKVEKDLHDESTKPDDVGKILEKSIFEEKIKDGSKTFDVKQDLKEDVGATEKDLTKTMIESGKSVIDVVTIPAGGTIESEDFHDKMADDLTQKLSTMRNVMDDLINPTPLKSIRDSESLSLSEDITKDESSSLQLSLSQTKLSEDITISPSMSEKVDIKDIGETGKQTSILKKEITPLLEATKLGKKLVDGKFVSELSGARVLEILEPEIESQSRQDSIDVSSIEVDEIKFSTTGHDVPIKEENLHESPAIDSLDALERDISMSSATFSEDTNIDYSLSQDGNKKQEFGFDKVSIKRRTEKDSFEIESPPLVSPRLKVKELEIKPVDWMIGDEKIEVSEALEPSEAFDKELEEYQMSLKQQQEGVNISGERKFEIPQIQETCSTSFDESESTKLSGKSKFTVIPVSEEDFDVEKELVENKLEISCQELMDTLQREYDAKTPTDDRLEEMAAKSFHFITIEDDDDGFDYSEKKYEAQLTNPSETRNESLKFSDIPFETKTAINVIEGEQFTSLVEPLKLTEAVSQSRDSELLQLYEEQFEETMQIKDLKKNPIEENKSTKVADKHETKTSETVEKTLDNSNQAGETSNSKKETDTVSSKKVEQVENLDTKDKEKLKTEFDVQTEIGKIENSSETINKSCESLNEKLSSEVDTSEKDKEDKKKQSYDLENFQHPPEPSEMLLKMDDEKSENEEKKDVQLLSYKTFDPEDLKKQDGSQGVTGVQKLPKAEFHKEGRIDMRSKAWDDHKRVGDKREKAHSHQETSPYKVKKEDFQNVNMSARYAITVLDQVVKKEIAEVKENLEAAKQDLIEELSENSENMIQIKDSPSEFQFKLQPESIPNELPFLYKAPSLEKGSDTENFSSSSSPVAKPRRHSEITREESSSESSSAEKKTSEQDKSKTSIMVESESDQSSQKESKDTFESFSSSQKVVSKSGSDAEVATKDETFSLQPPQPAPRRRPKPSRGQHGITSESEADVSSSGESNYQSCEYESSSRPCSSDVEALQSAAHPLSSTASEYETAAMSMEHSSKGTSQDYFTAMNTLSSRESMKSLASISSGQMGSLDSASELSETIMASEPELDQDALDENLENILDDDMKSFDDVSDDEEKHLKVDPEIPCMMKRSSEMIFSQVITQESSSEGQSLGAKLSDSSTLTVTETSSSITNSKSGSVSSEANVCVTKSTTTQKVSQKIMTTRNISEQPESVDELILSSSDLKAETCSFEPDSLEVKYTSTSSLDEESAEGHGPGSGLTLQQQLSMTSSSMSGVSLETVIEKEHADRNSPDSDSFELVDKPDIIDDFVVVEEVGREAHEFDSEGKGIRISSTSFVSSKIYDRDVENLMMEKQDLQKPQAQSTRSTAELFDFESEESPPQASNEDQYSQSYSDEEQYSESGKKWVEMQFQQNETRIYDLEYERGPLEDIKEEEVADFEAGSSRFGSVGSQKESIGSIGSMRGSFGSTPDNYDILTAKRYFKPTDHDNVSLSSLQEFEHLENAVAQENAKRREQQHSSSQDSSSNGSLPRRYHASKSGHGDDVSISSVKDFEVLEKACKEAHMIELRAREEEDLLDHESPENRYKLESLARAKAESQGSAPGSFNPSTSGSDDYEKRIKEIDEIIRLAQANVEKIERHDDTTEDISQIDLTDDKPTVPVTIIAAETPTSSAPVKAPPKSASDMNLMDTSTDSLELEGNGGRNYNVMCQSSDSLELKTTLDYPSISSDSLNNVKDPKEEQEKRFSSRRISSDSLDLPAQESQESKDKSKDSSTDS
ncbi:ankyrin-2-like isoform X2 [Copidosoma floridanum]|uniref:ankyrin-2-like isoform X2 n=1 Tax=Copidosoma floridanum TaxID=29053 RepID=UPI000C6F4A3B|nr:ankyrin-2-like isoform X2 [Copidosoma floridanum]